MGFFNVFSDHSSQRTNAGMRGRNACPNCWGEQEYQGAFWETSSNAHIDLNNILQKKGWIQAYIAKYLEGMHPHATD